MKKVCKYIIFILICLCTIPCVAKAWVFEGNYYRQNAGTLTAGNSYYSTYFSGWNYAHCENSSGGPFSAVYEGSASYGRLHIKANSFISKNYTNEYASCTVYTYSYPGSTFYSEYKNGKYYRYFRIYVNLSTSGSITPTPNTKEYDLYKNDTINLTSLLGISSIEEFTYKSGSENNTLGYSGCAVGSSACTINFTKGTPEQDRKHTFVITYKNTANKYYKTTVHVYEQDTTKTIDLGEIDVGKTESGPFEEDVSNFTCSAETSGPYTAEKNISGTKGRIKVTNTNKTTNSYTNQKAKCTFTKNGKSHTNYYTFSLKEVVPKDIEKEYTANGGETFDLWSDLNIKSIYDSTMNFSSAASVTGCAVGSTKCSVKMDGTLSDGRSSSSVIVYYDNSDVLTKAKVKIKEKVVAFNTDLGDIGVGSSKNVTIPAKDVTCAARSGGPFDVNTTKLGEYSYKVTITNKNETVDVYDDEYVTCTGIPSGVGNTSYKYTYEFDLLNNTVPFENSRSYELFPGESLDFGNLYHISKAQSYKFTKSGTVYSVSGCKNNVSNCVVTFSGSNFTHNRKSTLELTYINSGSKPYKTTITLIEKDPNLTTKAFPGLMGFCDFDTDYWEHAQWSDSSGKRYSFYETQIKSAVLPDCGEDTENGKLYEFKGWTKGYTAGDTLSTTTTCTDIVKAGSKVSMGETYAPCYQLVPHARLAVNGGTVDAERWKFNSSDMTYLATGSSYTDTVMLPDVAFTGFHRESTLKYWKNSVTGKTKAAGQYVPLDGSVWLAVIDSKVTKVDLYKTVAVNSVELFTVEGMKGCYLDKGTSSYLTVSYSGGDCKVTGVKATPFEQFVDVTVNLSGGSSRVYKFTVEDRTGVDQNGNGIFEVDTSQNIEIGENDSTITDGIYTDQCDTFNVSNTNYASSKVGFAASQKTKEIIYSGAYHVTDTCPTDNNTYVAFCLDPGRRGPGEAGIGTVQYIKVNDVAKESEMGRLVAYIVKYMGTENFDNFSNTTYSNNRVASHVALRIIAIKTGMSTAVDSADLVYSTHYYPYAAVAESLTAAAVGGDITLTEANAALTYTTGAGNGMSWTYSPTSSIPSSNCSNSTCSTSRFGTIKNLLAKILSEYDGSSGTPNDNSAFERTIDKTDVKVIEHNSTKFGYKLTYEGTITVPSGTTSANLYACNAMFGVSCTVEKFTDSGKVADGNRKIYNYKVIINATDASAVHVPQGESEEKAVSFSLTYNGDALVESAFIANPRDGSDNLQRMLILTTSSPKVYIYFDIVPNDCNMPSTNKDNCKTEATCKSYFNKELFVAAGCCRYLLDGNTYQYLAKNLCEATCTSSTLTSACEYTLSGEGKADFYEIREGEKIVDDTGAWEPNIGACVAQVQNYYVNDSASAVENTVNKDLFIYHDDAENLINVDAYKNNRYCQVTCKEDWDLSMDSFGNFVGKNAVAAGTYFQIISNDMFMSGTRTCYTSFINYDRFMNNIVDLSNELVDNYNLYSEWSHVWTDIDRQEDAGYSANSGLTGSQITNHSDGPICVEFADKCPSFHTNYVNTDLSTGTYFWEGSQVDGNNTGGCLQVPEYGNSGAISDSSCSTTRTGETRNRGDDYVDSDMTYEDGGDNDYQERCTFTRTYCDGGHNEKPADSETLVDSDTKCQYKTYKTRSTKSKIPKTCSYDTTSCSGEGENQTCTTTTHYYDCSYCPSDTTEVGGTCYSNSCPSGYPNSYSSTECWKYAKTSVHTKTFSYRPKYKETYLRCKVWGKAIDYTLKTNNQVYETNDEGYDVYYETYEKTPVAMVNVATSGDKGDTNTENYTNHAGYKSLNSSGAYNKTYTHQCTVTQGSYTPNGAVGTSSCAQSGYTGSYSGSDPSYNKMFCEKYAPTSSNKEAFCYVSDASTSDNYDASKVNTTSTNTNDAYNSDEKSAFEFMTEFMKRQAKTKSNTYKNAMMSRHSSIYSHAYDIFDCQHFQLHNNTDDMDSSRTNNSIANDTIMGMSRSYVKILTEFKPTAAYTYDEKAFMTILGEDNVLEQFTEKNDAKYGGEGKYASTTNAKVPIKIKLADGSEVDTNLYRNYIESSYYNPADSWNSVSDKDAYKNYHDEANAVKIEDFKKTVSDTGNIRSSKKVVMCSVGSKTFGKGTYEGKDGEVIAFSLKSSDPEWIGGRCYEVRVDYKNVHYVKSSISNSSYYKNKGYWYIRGGDVKEHGDNLEDALKKSNNRAGSKTSYVMSKEKNRWSRLGSFNVFPISMGTPRNLYQYTYTFGQIGSYYNGKLGRIMGTTKSIIKDNTRTCFYEVFEEVCLCCGYELKPGDLVESFIGKNNTYNGYIYNSSDSSQMNNNYNGTISFYSNSVSLGDLDLGRDSAATNWNNNQLFMYNGDDTLTTDKGAELKQLIEANGESIYDRSPEYAYYLTPDILKEIRYYNDSVGYELNYNNLKVYQSSTIACSDTGCSDTASEETINFQHYGSKFLLGEVTQNININNFAYGSIKHNTTKICSVTESSLPSMASWMENGQCRWIDYIETGNSYKDPATGDTPAAFRLAFK